VGLPIYDQLLADWPVRTPQPVIILAPRKPPPDPALLVWVRDGLVKL
jgi:hypothetical protein